jgi:hypothetical protein
MRGGLHLGQEFVEVDAGEGEIALPSVLPGRRRVFRERVLGEL